MLSIHTSQPVSWPSALPAQVAVQPVPGVGAAQPAARDPQAGSGRQGQGSQGGSPSTATRSAGDTAAAPAAQPAPLLPRERKDADRPSPADDLAESRVRAEQRQEEEQAAREQAEQKLQLQEVLATVWKASAAVVDVVLGREQEVAAAGGAAAAGAVGEGGAVARKTAANDAVQGDLPGIEAIPASLRRDQEPVAYTEQGTSTWSPLEAGSLLSRRV